MLISKFMLKFKQSSFFKLLFTLIFFELVVGGSGHYLEIGPGTFRMVLYSFAIILAFVYSLINNTIDKNVFVILVLFSCMLLLASFIGWSNGAKSELILEDLKPLIFAYILLFFKIAIKDISDILRIIKIIKVGSLIMGGIYVLVLLLMLSGKINPLTFYKQQSEIGELIFKSEILFIYKGFLYLCIGFLFFLLSKGKSSLFAAIFLLGCIVLTLMRGFILFTILISLYYIYFINKNIRIKWLILFISFSLFIYALPILFEVLGDKSDSDGMRFIQISEVIDDISPFSMIFGHGFGVGTESRPVHMELSFLEIFHKQGLIGLTSWVGIYLFIFWQYSRIKIDYYKYLALPFLLSVIFIVLQSFTNPFMNNPIGLSMILITIVVYSKLIDLQNKITI
jgi:hypothetical protein